MSARLAIGGLTSVCLVAFAMCHLALVDIAHGGEDLTAEWLPVRVGLVTIVLTQLGATTVAWTQRVKKRGL